MPPFNSNALRTSRRAIGSVGYSTCRAAALICLYVLAGHAPAGVEGADALSTRYQALHTQLETSPLGLPITVESLEAGGLIRGEVYAILVQPFALLAARLHTPSDWCQIALLHLNIKTCTHERRMTSDWLTLYSGRKFYEPPEKAHSLHFAFQVPFARADYLEVVLTAESGPFDTRDYQIVLEAVPIPQGTFVHFRYAYRPSNVSRLATSGYLATLGSGKTGFTVISRGRDGKVQYVGGVRGVAERNAVRYYLAIQAFLETLDAPEAQRFERRLERWYELTERYRAQLHELEKTEYMQCKRQEYRHQIERQQALDASAANLQTKPLQ